MKNKFFITQNVNQDSHSWFPVEQFDRLEEKSKYLVIYHLNNLLEIFAQSEESTDTSLRLLIIQLKQKLT